MSRIRKDDNVLVITGKDRGKRGKVLRLLPTRDRLVVEGINIIKRHVKARPPLRQAGIIQQEAPIHQSNVMLACPKCQRGVRIGFRNLEDGTKVRLCRACGEVVD